MQIPTKPILQFALELAAEAHKGQKRKDGKEYITHPVRVYEILSKDILGCSEEFLKEANQLTQFHIPQENVFDFRNQIVIRLISAYCHDIAEDTEMDETGIVDRFILAGYLKKGDDMALSLFHNLKTLNKNFSGSYLEYIQGFFFMDDARLVKLADLTHNLSDLKPGSLRDKYELAKYLLENCENLD